MDKTNELREVLVGHYEAAANKVLEPDSAFWILVDGVIIVLLAWLIGRAIHAAVERILSRPKHIPADPTAIHFLAQLARAGVYVLAFLTFAHLVPALRSIGDAWLASVGVASVVFGLAAQNTLGNLVAGISLLLYRPFSLGDRIQVMAPTGVETGVVENLNLGYTVLRTADGRRVVIPNNAMINQTSVNLSTGDPRLTCSVPVVVAGDADIARARAILSDLAKKHALAREVIGCPVTALAATATTVTLQVWCDDYSAAQQLKNDLLEQIRPALRSAGIELR